MAVYLDYLLNDDVKPDKAVEFDHENTLYALYGRRVLAITNGVAWSIKFADEHQANDYMIYIVAPGAFYNRYIGRGGGGCRRLIDYRAHETSDDRELHY